MFYETEQTLRFCLFYPQSIQVTEWSLDFGMEWVKGGAVYTHTYTHTYISIYTILYIHQFWLTWIRQRIDNTVEENNSNQEVLHISRMGVLVAQLWTCWTVVT